ncbi:hypothetical protein JHK86_047753 [Glycine max]|nr:hypothetical protein JHK86_047753 [Glycine max]
MKQHVRYNNVLDDDGVSYLEEADIPNGDWFCPSCRCRICGQRKINGDEVGQFLPCVQCEHKFSVSVDDLTRKLVKFINPDSCELGSSQSDLLAESYNKLNLALSVMHECFEPLKVKAKPIEFLGFLYVLLERNAELISVATDRVYRKKVAEVPLIGHEILSQRSQGVRYCDVAGESVVVVATTVYSTAAISQAHAQLGVEWLVLPVVPSVLETWTLLCKD